MFACPAGVVSLLDDRPHYSLVKALPVPPGSQGLNMFVLLVYQ